jgi:hypothetical protein
MGGVGQMVRQHSASAARVAICVAALIACGGLGGGKPGFMAKPPSAGAKYPPNSTADVALGAAKAAPAPPEPTEPATSAKPLTQQRVTTAKPESALASITDAVRVEQLTGPGSVNATDSRWNVYGADVGLMFTNVGSLYMVFGDTYGPGHGDWRSNTMARVASTNPADGLHFESMITDTTGAASQLLDSLKVDGVEHTVIPTAAISVGPRMILQYMSVRRWLTPGRWQLNYSGLAYSDDAGKTWVKDPVVEWPGNSNFGEVAMVAENADIYMLGVPAGRFGGVQVARVPEDEVLQSGAYRYWDGVGWNADPATAVTVVPPDVGELSVRWSGYLHRWMMLYLDESRASIMLRTAPALTGPWSVGTVVVTAAQYPTLYAPNFVPGDTGRDVFFTMSQNASYEVYLMRGTLDLKGV